MHLSKSDRAEAVATLLKDLADGDSEAEVAEIMGWDSATLAYVRKTMLESEAQRMRKMPREHVYVQYCMEQRRNVRDLDDLITHLDKKQQYNAVIGAIRLRSDIADKIITKGQEFGVIRKEAERKEHILVGGIIVGDMTAPQLRTAIGTEMNELKVLMEKFGDQPINALSPGALHYGPKAAKFVESKTKVVETPKPVGKARAKTSRRSAGRKMVRLTVP